MIESSVDSWIVPIDIYIVLNIVRWSPICLWLRFIWFLIRNLWCPSTILNFSFICSSIFLHSPSLQRYSNWLYHLEGLSPFAYGSVWIPVPTSDRCVYIVRSASYLYFVSLVIFITGSNFWVSISVTGTINLLFTYPIDQVVINFYLCNSNYFDYALTMKNFTWRMVCLKFVTFAWEVLRLT